MPKTKISKVITTEELREVLEYNPITGLFYWKESRGPNAVKGSKAGCASTQGDYWDIKVGGSNYRAHKLAWQYVYGIIPNKIDHIDSNRRNNSITNLREVSRSENTLNLENAPYEEVFKAFSYNSTTGLLTRKIKTVGNSIGDTAGHINAEGYVVVKYHSKAFKAHRLAWLLTYKQWPKGVIDHIDGNKSNNAILNLRDVSNSTNSLNTSLVSKNKSGYKGVTFHHNKWRSRIMVDGVSIIIGSFNTPEEASSAYEAFKKEFKL